MSRSALFTNQFPKYVLKIRGLYESTYFRLVSTSRIYDRILAGNLRKMAEAIRTTVLPISCVIRTTVVRISGIIGPTVVRIANATGIGYRHDGSIRFSNKLTYALNF